MLLVNLRSLILEVAQLGDMLPASLALPWAYAIGASVTTTLTAAFASLGPTEVWHMTKMGQGAQHLWFHSVSVPFAILTLVSDSTQLCTATRWSFKECFIQDCDAGPAWPPAHGSCSVFLPAQPHAFSAAQALKVFQPYSKARTHVRDVQAAGRGPRQFLSKADCVWAHQVQGQEVLHRVMVPDTKNSTACS